MRARQSKEWTVLELTDEQITTLSNQLAILQKKRQYCLNKLAIYKVGMAFRYRGRALVVKLVSGYVDRTVYYELIAESGRMFPREMSETELSTLMRLKDKDITGGWLAWLKEKKTK